MLKYLILWISKFILFHVYIDSKYIIYSLMTMQYDAFIDYDYILYNRTLVAHGDTPVLVKVLVGQSMDRE